MALKRISAKAFLGIRRRAINSGRIVVVHQSVKKTKGGMVVVKEHTRTNAHQMSNMEFRSKAKVARSRAMTIQSTRQRALKGMY